MYTCTHFLSHVSYNNSVHEHLSNPENLGFFLRNIGIPKLEVPTKDKAYDSGRWFRGYTPKISKYGQKHGTVPPL